MNSTIERATEVRNVLRERDQTIHGHRVEERQRVNGQPNGYRPISEAELRAEKNAEPLHGYQIWIHGRRDQAITRKFPTSWEARRYMAGAYAVPVTDVVARRIFE